MFLEIWKKNEKYVFSNTASGIGSRRESGVNKLTFMELASPQRRDAATASCVKIDTIVQLKVRGSVLQLYHTS